MLPVIDKLQGTYLSNFWECPVTYEGLTYRNAEAAYQASKCADETYREYFTQAPGYIAKARGRRIKIRKDWTNMRLVVMWEILQAKFAQNPDLLAQLIATGDQVIIETNTWNDKFWGVCNGEGENHLGIMLMTIRAMEGK
jgi:ribA/ribD-fused uncharacterized protein